MASGGFGGYGQVVASAGGSVPVNNRHPAAKPASSKQFVGTEKEIASAELTLSQAEDALDLVCEKAETDTQVVEGFSAELAKLSAQLSALGAGAAMEEVERKLAVARAAVEKLGVAASLQQLGLPVCSIFVSCFVVLKV